MARGRASNNKRDKKVFLSLSCMSEKCVSKEPNNDLYNLFDKKCDKRDLEKGVLKLNEFNNKAFEFLGIEVDYFGSGQNYKLCFSAKNSRYIGAIPIRMPYDNVPHSDLLLQPCEKFGDSPAEAMSNITILIQEISSFFNSDIKVEHLENHPLVYAENAKPPMYYDAAKYIELFFKAQSIGWHKFKKEIRVSNYPKGSTDWRKYALNSYNPQKRLEFVCNDNVLSQNHREWQELVYVYQLAKSEIFSSSTPRSILIKYNNIINIIDKKVSDIKPTLTNTCKKNMADPLSIKQLKEQANILLQQKSTVHEAWRIDVAELFERFAQYIFVKALSPLGGSVTSNDKVWKSGGRNIPWTLRYLEPDITITLNDRIIFADAKYKRNLYVTEQSDILKETHRHDLHQLLAYCSFSKSKNSTGILVYPYQSDNNIIYKEKISYTNGMSNITNTVFLIGIPFDHAKIDETVSAVKDFFSKNIIGEDNHDN